MRRRPRHQACEPTGATRLECRALRLVRGERCLVESIDLALEPGEIVGLVGPNGAGKSTLLATLAGLSPPAAGQVTIGAQALKQFSRREVAQRLGFLPQDTEDPYPASVLQTALIGRHPHIGFWHWESHQDVTTARAALAHMGLTQLAEHDIATLSGGERRRLAIAAILAQAPLVYLLDEPLEALDLSYQASLLRLVRRLAQKNRASILVSMHDLSVAARHADRIVLLDGRGGSEVGRADAVLRADKLSRVYGCRLRRIEVEGFPFFLAD